MAEDPLEDKVLDAIDALAVERVVCQFEKLGAEVENLVAKLFGQQINERSDILPVSRLQGVEVPLTYWGVSQPFRQDRSPRQQPLNFCTQNEVASSPRGTSVPIDEGMNVVDAPQGFSRQLDRFN